jgi:sarcosine oxidase subunit beta
LEYTCEGFPLIGQADIVIIGGGCVGTSIAYHLAKMGSPKVILLEKEHLAWGATGKSSAIVNLGVWNASKPLVKMLTESINVFHNFQSLVGGRCGFNQTAWVGLAGEEQAHRVEKTAKAERALGAKTSLVSISELKELEPRLFTNDLVQVVYEPSSGYADPVDTTNSFARQAERMGAKIFTGVRVTAIKVDGGRVRGVETDKGPVEAAKVVNAANVWAGKLFSGLGITLPIAPSRKQVCLFKRPPEFGKPHMIIDDFVNDLYIKPEGEQTLVGEIEAPGSPIDPDNYDETVDYDRIPLYSEKLVHRIPGMGAAMSRGGYAGPYDVSPDGHPILGEVPGVRGLYCAVGFSGHGFRFSPATGRLMAEFILHSKTTGIDIMEFRMSRFTEGKPITAIA